MNETIEIMKTANEYLYNLTGGIRKLVDEIEKGNNQDAIALIPDISEGIGWIINVVTLTKDHHKNEFDVTIINEKLNEVVDALQNEDYILIGDLFNYEILPIIESIHEIISKVAMN